MKNVNSGFTLIELVTVIVVLGILATVAAPKFINLSSDARASVINGLTGAMRSTVQIRHSHAQINAPNGGLENGYISDDDVFFDQGYPIAIDYDTPGSPINSGDGMPEILEAMNLDLDDWVFNTVFSGNHNGRVTRELYISSAQILSDGASVQDIIDSGCYLNYETYVVDALPPEFNAVTTGC